MNQALVRLNAACSLILEMHPMTSPVEAGATVVVSGRTNRKHLFTSPTGAPDSDLKMVLRQAFPKVCLNSLNTPRSTCFTLYRLLTGAFTHRHVR
jgi:hypothetical protein